MDGRIGHLHCRYRVVGERGAAGTVTARLDRVAQEQVAQAWTEALGQALGDDPAVYVLRRVDARLALGLDGAQDDARLAQRWGDRLAGAVMQRLAHDPDDGANLVRFADQADYVAHFVTDLLHGRAWQRWFYGAFAPLRSHSTPDAVRTVLLDNRDHLPAVLGYLHRYGALESLLTVLDEPTLQLLWSHGLGAYVRPAPDAVRPIFAGALRLMDRLDLWARLRPGDEGLFEAYLASEPPAADWQDPAGLTSAVLDVLRFLAEQGYLRRPIDVQDEAFLSRLDQALDNFDWLDTDRLRHALLGLLGGEDGRTIDLPVRPAGAGPTPRQRELLADLLAVLRQRGRQLDRSRPDSPPNALRLYAWLIAHAPRWTDDAAAAGLIQRLLTAWAGLERADSRAEAVHRLRQGDVQGALQTLPEEARVGAAGIFKFLADLGAPGLAVTEALAGGDDSVRMPVDAGVETQCAGVFLLLRAILDARLPMLVEGADFRSLSDFGSLSATLLALGLRWAGEPALAEGRVDAGLSLLAGRDEPPTLDALRDAWSATGPVDHDRFQAALLRVLAGQRLVAGDAMHVYHLPLDDAHAALVAGDGAAGLWPLGRVIDSMEDVATIVSAWLELWEKATGRRPDLVLGKEETRFLPKTWFLGAGERASLHTAGRQALQETLKALDYGRLDLPRVDLTVGLAAGALLRIWSRWLRQFADSSVPYLLDNFVRRPGRLFVDPNYIVVEMAPGPLDVVIEMAGYTAELERVPWLGRRVQFRLRG